MQQLLITFGSHCLDFGDYADQKLRPFYFQALTDILTRDELSLACLSLADSNKETKKIFDQKLEVAIAYQIFIYEVLGYCIKNLNLRDVEQYKQKFIENAISIGFFHIPDFRGNFLKLMSEKDLNSIKL